ncbi:pseudouridine synthase, partial [Fusobacterium periodonticum]
MRLDRFLVECGIGSRKEVKKIISAKEIKVNGSYDISAKDNIDEYSDVIEYNGERLEYKEFRYYIMNKKAGYITATEDTREATVMDLLPEWVIRKDLAPVGRLDKDTEGLLLLTNDGKLNHKLLSPKNHVDKTYYVEIENNISQEDILKLEEGVDIGNYITLPAKVEKISDTKIYLTIKEGK